MCTLINKEGNSVCECCGTPAPATAIIFVKSIEDLKREKDEEEKRIKDQLEAIEKEERERVEAAEKAKLLEEQEKQRLAEEARRKMELELLETMTREYFEGAEVKGWLFASVKGGNDTRPYLSGAVMKNPFGPTHDIHIASLAYRHSYLSGFINRTQGPKPKCQICDVPFINVAACVRHMLSSHRDAVEGLYPAFIST